MTPAPLTRPSGVANRKLQEPGATQTRDRYLSGRQAHWVTEMYAAPGVREDAKCACVAQPLLLTGAPDVCAGDIASELLRVHASTWRIADVLTTY